MKLRYFLGVALSVLLFAGCSDENQRMNTYGDISLSQSYLSIPEEGGDVKVTIKANQDWKFDKVFSLDVVTGKDENGKDIKETKYFALPVKLNADKTDGEYDWLTASQLEGPAGETTVTFHADKTEGGREAALVIVMGGIKQNLIVRQGSLEAQNAKVIDVLNGTVGKSYRITGTVSAWYNNAEQYGNYYITDETGTIIVYGTADKEGKLKNYPLKSWGIELGDVITVEGNSGEYKGTPQLVDVTVVKLVKSLLKVVTPEPTVAKEGGDIEVKVAYKGSGAYFNISDDAKNWVKYADQKYIPGEKTLFEANPADTIIYKFSVSANDGDARTAVITFTSSKDSNSSSLSYTIKQEASVLPHGQDPTDPFSVAEAIAKSKEIGTTSDGVDYYIKGVVSKAPTSFTASYGNLGYYISADGKQENELQVYRGFSFNGDHFTAQDDIRVGDVVLIKGKLKLYNNAAEIDANNQLVTLNMQTSMDGINNPGTLRNPFDIAGVISFIDAGKLDENVFVKGVVSKVDGAFGAQYGNGTFWISDDGNYYEDSKKDFEAYRVYWLGNQKWVDGDSQIAVGDQVILHGQVTLYTSKGIYETNQNKAYVFSVNGQVKW